jgi:predicted kinase
VDIKKQQVVYILTGLVGSGKSYWSTDFIKKPKNSQNTVIVNKDKLREMFHGRYKFKPDFEEFIHEMSVDLIKKSIRNGYNVIIDETNITKERREKWIDIVKKENEYLKIIYVWFSDTENNLKNRMKNPKGVSKEKWKNVIDSMKRRFEIPSVKELYDDLIIINSSIEEEHNKINQDKNLPQAICFDLDGTLAHIGDRDPYDASKCEEDIPDDNLIELINFYKEQYKIIFMTARPYDYKEPTMRFLKKCGFDIENDGTFSMVMRNPGDFRKDAIVKEEMYRKFVIPNYYVKLIFDDRTQVVNHLRNIGFTVYQVAPGNF